MKKEIRFIQAFTCEEFGNVYLGKVVRLNSKQANFLIEHGCAELVEKKDDSEPSRDKAASKGRSRRRR